jgi:ABC-type thiamine transport system ATPase subunit
VINSEQDSSYNEYSSYSSLKKNILSDIGMNSIQNNMTGALALETKKIRQDVFDLLKMLSHKFRRTIIMVTHNRELAEATDRSIHIRDGTIEKEVINDN